MRTEMSIEQNRAFEEITRGFGKLKEEHGLEDIKGAAVPKNKIPDYISLFVEKGYYTYNEDTRKYKITPTGERLFEQLRRQTERRAHRGRLIY